MRLDEFLLERVAEDEAVACEPHDSVRAERIQDMERVGWDDRCGYARAGLGRILAECEAKRRIVEEARELVDPEPGDDPFADADMLDDGQVWAFADVLRNLAAVYADHPDFDPAWRMG